MPIDDDIHILICSIFHAVSNQGFQVLPVTVCTIPAALCSIQGKPDHIHIPFFTELPEALLIDIVGKPGKTVCTKSSKLNGIPVTIQKPGTLHMQGSC